MPPEASRQSWCDYSTGRFHRDSDVQHIQGRTLGSCGRAKVARGSRPGSPGWFPIDRMSRHWQERGTEREDNRAFPHRPPELRYARVARLMQRTRDVYIRRLQLENGTVSVTRRRAIVKSPAVTRRNRHSTGPEDTHRRPRRELGRPGCPTTLLCVHMAAALRAGHYKGDFPSGRRPSGQTPVGDLINPGSEARRLGRPNK